jgi:hypothetical protein
MFLSRKIPGKSQSLKNICREKPAKKSSPYGSAMSMLTFYINRTRKNLEHSRKEVLEKAKDELRLAFGREPKNNI